LTWDGLHVVSQAEKVGDAMAELCEHDPRLRATIERMFTVGTWGKVGAVAAGVFVPIAAVHGIVPRMMAAPFADVATMPEPPTRAQTEPASDRIDLGRLLDLKRKGEPTGDAAAVFG
jgi:hypothetical protein